MLKYQIIPSNLGAHLFTVNIEVPSGEGSVNAKMPKWIPGSYKIRDFSRHIQSVNAFFDNGQPVNWHKIDSDTWVFDAQQKKINIVYQVYAYDLSVRGAYLDDRRLFFNFCALCLDVIHLSQSQRRIKLHAPKNWQLFTTLPKVGEYYLAESYWHQIDHPVESAIIAAESIFKVNNIPHKMVFTGDVSDEYDIERMTCYIAKICQKEADLFGELPLNQYLFLNYIEPNQYGGLEHSDSVAQMASPEMMINKSTPNDIGSLTEPMLNFLGLCSHEYFHLWNVKRLQPNDFIPYELSREQHTEMLWMFEGFTSYYDELFLARAGIVSQQTFLDRQAKNINRVLSIPGRKLQTLAQSSFDAWTKLYQADENSANHMVSYYAKGAIFALTLDLMLRVLSSGRYSLDDVMRTLWKSYAKQSKGVNEKTVISICEQLLSSSDQLILHDFFKLGLHGVEDIPVTDWLIKAGIEVSWNKEKVQGKSVVLDSGIKLRKTAKNSIEIAFLDSGSDAAQQGVSVKDELLAINNLQSTIDNYQKQLSGIDSHQKQLKLTLLRRGRVMNKTISLVEAKSKYVAFSWGTDNQINASWLI